MKMKRDEQLHIVTNDTLSARVLVNWISGGMV
jgi:hypothetical protein